MIAIYCNEKKEMSMKNRYMSLPMAALIAVLLLVSAASAQRDEPDGEQPVGAPAARRLIAHRAAACARRRRIDGRR